MKMEIMKNEKNYKYIIIICILAFLLLFCGALSVFSTVQYNQARADNDRLTERVNRTTDTCTRLTETIGECQSICRQLDESSRRDISDIRDAIEIIEETRYYIACLSYYIDSGSSDELYNRTDDWLEHEGVEFVK